MVALLENKYSLLAEKLVFTTVLAVDAPLVYPSCTGMEHEVLQGLGDRNIADSCTWKVANLVPYAIIIAKFW